MPAPPRSRCPTPTWRGRRTEYAPGASPVNSPAHDERSSLATPATTACTGSAIPGQHPGGAECGMMDGRESSPLPIGMVHEPGIAVRGARRVGPVTQPPTSPLTGMLIADFGSALDNLGLALQTRKGLAAARSPRSAQLPPAAPAPGGSLLRDQPATIESHCAHRTDNLLAPGTQSDAAISRSDSAGRMWVVLPALLPWFRPGGGVGSGAWVPA